MNLFQILSKIFTEPKSDWILKVQESDINKFMIQRYLSIYPNTHLAARILNKHLNLPERMYLSVAWSLVFKDKKKYKKAPFIKYPKKDKSDDNKHSFLLKKYQQEHNISNKDLEFNKELLIKEIEKEPHVWLRYYGANRTLWTNYNLHYSLMRNKSVDIKKKTLQDFY